MAQPRVITARSPRRMPRGINRDDHMTLRVFPGASTSIATGISNQPQQFYPHSSQNNQQNNHQHRNQPIFANHQHLQGFANTPSEDNMMDINIS